GEKGCRHRPPFVTKRGSRVNNQLGDNFNNKQFFISNRPVYPNYKVTTKTTFGLEGQIMKRAIYGALMLAVAWIGTAKASDPVGIYARVDRVSMEPNEQTPERIKIWGAFSMAAGRGDTYLAPECGYLYFQIDPGHEKQCRAEWADFGRVA